MSKIFIGKESTTSKTTVSDFQRARDYFEQMLQKDPQNARGWTGIAMSNLNLAAFGDPSRAPLAKAAALKAIELDDSLAEAHAELGMLSFHFEWNVPEAERQLRRAIELNPNYYRAHSYYSIMLAQLGRSDEAHEQFREARTLDTLSAFSAAVGWHVFYCARQYDETIKVCRAALEMESGIASAYYGLVLSFEQRREYEKAIQERLRSLQPGKRCGSLRRALASGGERGYWKESLVLFLENHNAKDPSDLDEAARIYTCISATPPTLWTGWKKRTKRTIPISFSGFSQRPNLIPSMPNPATRKSSATCT
jgi:tetratricopeptide (TPR) repeat protein